MNESTFTTTAMLTDSFQFTSYGILIGFVHNDLKEIPTIFGGERTKTWW